MSVLMEPGHVTEYPLNHARILYGNAITAATATGARAKFPASAALTETTYERWSPAESGDSITLTFPSQNINAIALAAHSELQPTIEVRHNGAFIDVTAYPTNDDPSLISDFTTDTHQLLNYSPDNQAILFLLKPRRIDAIRITVTYSGTAPTLGVVRAGNVLEMARPFYQGHNPAILAADNTLRPNVSESGEWLGASLIRQGRSVKMDWKNIASSWIREKWTPFSKTIKTSPFIIAWNAKKFSTDVFYCSSSDTPMPTHSGPRDLMSVSLSARGYSDGTEPEVLNLAASTFDDLFTFTRASVATITDIDGMLREVGADVPRLVEYDGAGGALGLLIEEARTNVITRSQPTVADNYWQALTDTTLSDVTLAGLPALRVTRDTGTGGLQALITNTQGNPNNECFRTMIVRVSDPANQHLKLRIAGDSGSGYFVSDDRFHITFDLSSKTVVYTGSNTGTAEIKELSVGVFKLTLNQTFTDSVALAANGWAFRLSDQSDASDYNTSQVPQGSWFEFTACQREELVNFPSSYIPTAGTQVTRAADDCVRVLGDEFNPNEWTIYLHYSARGYSFDQGGQVFFSISDGSQNEYLGLYNRNGYNPAIILFYGGDLEFVSNHLSLTVDEVRVGITYTNGVYSICINGNNPQNFNGQFSEVFNVLSIGRGVSAESTMNGEYKDLRLFPTALTDAELITLTGGT